MLWTFYINFSIKLFFYFKTFIFYFLNLCFNLKYFLSKKIHSIFLIFKINTFKNLWSVHFFYSIFFTPYILLIISIQKYKYGVYGVKNYLKFLIYILKNFFLLFSILLFLNFFSYTKNLILYSIYSIN